MHSFPGQGSNKSQGPWRPWDKNRDGNRMPLDIAGADNEEHAWVRPLLATLFAGFSNSTAVLTDRINRKHTPSDSCS